MTTISNSGTEKVFHSRERRRKVGWISEKREHSYFGPNYEDEPATNSKLKSWMRWELRHNLRAEERPKWSEVVVYKSHNSYISNIQQMLPLSWAGVKIFQQEEKWPEKRYSASKGSISTLRRISKHFRRKRKELRRRSYSTSQGEGFPPSLCTSHTFPDKHTIIPPHLCRQQKKKDMKQEYSGGTII